MRDTQSTHPSHQYSPVKSSFISSTLNSCRLPTVQPQVLRKPTFCQIDHQEMSGSCRSVDERLTFRVSGQHHPKPRLWGLSGGGIRSSSEFPRVASHDGAQTDAELNLQTLMTEVLIYSFELVCRRSAVKPEWIPLMPLCMNVKELAWFNHHLHD